MPSHAKMMMTWWSSSITTSKKAIKLVKSSEINIVIGDFNAKVGKDRRDSVVDLMI